MLGLFTDLSVGGGSPVAITLSGGQAMMIGTLLLCYRKIMARTSMNEEALRFQYDIGYEAGHQEGRQCPTERPVLVELRAHRRN
jgi:hypothetical protein